MIPTPRRPAAEKKPVARGASARTRGRLLVIAGLSLLLFATIGGGLPSNELFALGRDGMLPGGVSAGLVPELSALDLFQLAMALFVGLTFKRFLD